VGNRRVTADGGVTPLLTPHRLLILESAAKVGGIQQTTLDLVCRIDRSRWDALVVCPEEGDLPRRCRAADVAVKIFPLPNMASTSFLVGVETRLPNPFAWAWNFGAILVAASRLNALLRREQPDVVLTKGLLCHFYGALASRAAGIPCVWHVQDFVSERFGGIYRYVFGQLARRLPAHIVANSGPVLSQVPAEASGRASLMTNGIDLQAIRPGADGTGIREEFGIAANAIVIGNISRITPWKGQHHLIEAFAGVARLNAEAHLMIVGGPLFGSVPYEKKLRERVGERGLSRRVTFTGQRGDLRELLGAMDIFAYTAVEKDAWPLSLLLAMASGLPVVAFDIEGVREAMGTGVQASYLVPVGDIGRFAESLAVLAGDQALRDEASRASRARVEQACNLDDRVARMEEILGSVVRRNVVQTV
jgi:glycosyltransferase involved in cell wall biosynthesis